MKYKGKFKRRLNFQLIFGILHDEYLIHNDFIQFQTMIGQGLQTSNKDLDLSSALQIIANTVAYVYLQYHPTTELQDAFVSLDTQD